MPIVLAVADGVVAVRRAAPWRCWSRSGCASATSRTTRSASSRSCGRSSGSVPEGRIIALNGEAGYQADLLRGGIHFGCGGGSTASTRCALVTVPQGKIGYVYARDGEPLPPSQTLGRVVAVQQLPGRPRVPARRRRGRRQRAARGQRGRQRAILREGVYAINPALFVVITEDAVSTLPASSRREQELRDRRAVAQTS